MSMNYRTVSIGRSHECDIVINLPEVSRKHATIIVDNGVFRLRDSGSVNGVFVNGHKVLDTIVSPTDRVSIGNVYDLSWEQIQQACHVDAAPQIIQPEASHAKVLSVGRAPDNDIVISDPNVSRHHATIRFEGGRYYIQDMDSRNGVYVNGGRISSSEISPEDAIYLGSGCQLSWHSVSSAFSGRDIQPQKPFKPGIAPAQAPRTADLPKPIDPGKKNAGKAGTWIAAVLLGLLVLAGGGYLLVKNRDRAPDLNIEPILSKDAVSVPSNVVVEASEGQVVLSANADPSSYQTGKVMASGVSDGAPYGFLRKVTGYSEQNGQILVSTAPASLDDAFDQLGLDIRSRLYPGNVASSRPLTDGVVFSPGLAICAPPMVSGLQARSVKASVEPDPFLFNYAIDKTVPLSNGISMNISGDLNISLGFVLQARLEVLKGAVYVKSGSIVESKGNLQVSVNGAFAHKAKLELYEHKFPPFQHIVMGIPIILHPKVVVVLEIDASGSSTVTTSISANASLEAGAEYLKEKWRPYSNKDFQFQYNPPALEASMQAYISAGPRFELNLYDMAGPYAYARGFLELKGDINTNPLWTLDGGYRVDVGARVEGIGKIYEYNIPDIILQRQQLASASSKKEQSPVPAPVVDQPTETNQAAQLPNPGDPRPLFVDIINGNWNSARQIADMFETSQENSRDMVLELLSSEPTKNDQLYQIHLDFLGVGSESPSRIKISTNDLTVRYPRPNIAEIRFTEAAVRRLAPILSYSDPMAGLYGQYKELQSADYDRALNNLNSSILRTVREPKYFLLENGAWKCSLYDEMLQ